MLGLIDCFTHQIFNAMLIKIKARGYNRASESFVDKWLNSADLEDQAQVKELKSALWKMMKAECLHNRSTTFRLVLVPEDDTEDDDDLIDFSSSKSKKKKSKKVVEDDDEDDDE